MTPEEFLAILQSPPEVKPISYRLYHDEAGRPLFYSMEDLPGTYVEVDAEAYAISSHDVKVVDGKVVPLPKKIYTRKLKPSDQGVACHPQDVCVVVSEDQPHIKWKLHDQS